MFPLRLSLRIGRFSPLQEIPQRGQDHRRYHHRHRRQQRLGNKRRHQHACHKAQPQLQRFCSAAALPLLSGNGISAFATMIG